MKAAEYDQMTSGHVIYAGDSFVDLIVVEHTLIVCLLNGVQ